jgi:hypothetical protein
MAATLAAGAPLLAGGPPGWLAYAGLAVLTIGGAYVVSQMSGADEDAESSLGTGAVADACSSCRPPGDPCAGLRRQLREHEEKLRAFRNDPYSRDNLGILGHSPERDARIIAGRIRNLEGQIENFRRQLAQCERDNAQR